MMGLRHFLPINAPRYMTELPCANYCGFTLAGTADAVYLIGMTWRESLQTGFGQVRTIHRTGRKVQIGNGMEFIEAGMAEIGLKERACVFS